MDETIVKPNAPLVTVEGPVDGNVFAVIGAVKRALTRGGYRTEANQFAEDATTKCRSYDEVLQLAMSYADFDL